MISKQNINFFEKIIGKKNIYSDPGDCWSYGYDNSKFHELPEAVLFPKDKTQLKNIVEYCYKKKINIAPRGRGTGNTGGSVPLNKCIVISFERMDKIIKIDIKNHIAIVQPGVINKNLQDILNKKKFFWAPDPSSWAYSTVGGNIANNSAGPRAIKYGTPRENILGLEFISGKGEIHRTGVATTKGVVGLDITRLLIGSEGVLGIITEATLKIIPKINKIITVEICYKNFKDAIDMIIRVMSHEKIFPYSIEFIDSEASELINDLEKDYYPKKSNALLFQFEILDLKDTVSIEKIIKKLDRNSLRMKIAENINEQDKIWKARKSLSPALRKLGEYKVNEDVVVPVANLSTFLKRLKSMSKKYNIKIVNFGHAGNGNIHVNLIYPNEKEKNSTKAKMCLDEIFNLVLSLDGTLSGEHGIGIIKKDYIGKEIPKETLKLMKKIKDQFDPKNILNPGKSI